MFYHNVLYQSSHQFSFNMADAVSKIRDGVTSASHLVLTTPQKMASIFTYAAEAVNSTDTIQTILLSILDAVPDDADLEHLSKTTTYSIPSKLFSEVIAGLSDIPDDMITDWTLRSNTNQVCVSFARNKNSFTVATKRSNGDVSPVIVFRRNTVDDDGAVTITPSGVWDCVADTKVPFATLFEMMAQINANKKLMQVIQVASSLAMSDKFDAPTFVSEIQSLLPSVEGDAMRLYQLIIPYMNAGSQEGICDLLSGFFHDMGTMKIQSNTLGYSDNAQFAFKDACAGVLQGFAQTATVLLSTIGAAISNIVRAFVSAASLAYRAFSAFSDSVVGELTEVKINVTADDRCFPYGLFHDLPYTALPSSTLTRLSTLPFDAYYWHSDGDTPHTEWFLRATMIMTSKDKFTEYIRSVLKSDSDESHYVLKTNKQIMANILSADFLAQSELDITAPSAVVDEALRARFMIAMFVVLLVTIPWQDSSGQPIHYRALNDGSVFDWFYTLGNDLLWGTQYVESWEDIYQRLSHLNFFSFPLNAHVVPTTMSISGDKWLDLFVNNLRTYFGDRAPIYGYSQYSACTSKSSYYLALPKYTKYDVFNATFYSLSIAAAVSGAVVLTVVSVTKMLNHVRASCASKVEAAWAKYTASPTASNYDAYKKAVKRNNTIVKCIGGTTYSTQNFWNGSSGQESENKQDVNFDTILNLIKGSETSSDNS